MDALHPRHHPGAERLARSKIFSTARFDPSSGSCHVEEVKWKKPSRPQGVLVWSHDGNICFADILKNAVRLTFPIGAQKKDPHKLFNTRLDSKTVRHRLPRKRPCR
jgi:hypothetical protein